MRAEESWLIAAAVFIAALMILVSAPVWSPALLAGVCLAMSWRAHKGRKQYLGSTGRARRKS